MIPTNTGELALEALIVRDMTTNEDGWRVGDPKHYDRQYGVDLGQMETFLQDTQPQIANALALDEDGPIRRSFLARLQGEITKRGIVDVLRKGIKHGQHEITLFYGSPSPGNTRAQALYGQNRFTVTRQLRYSRDETQLALDLGFFINGLPVATGELKNNLSKQTVHDAIEQYKAGRDPRELIFQFGRCMAHFAIDDQEVFFCTALKGRASWFLPFNKGWQDGAGNPPNPDGLKTDYLWKEVLRPDQLTEIIENYAQVITEKDPRTGKKRSKQLFPRYHQRDVVRKLLTDAQINGAGQKYLIQHSAGSGKSNSIAWLSHQLIGLERQDKPVFDTVIVVTDRVILDQQIRDAIKQFVQVSSTIGHAERSGDLKAYLASGKKIIITTVQKFPLYLTTSVTNIGTATLPF